eukprot:PhM_4_TR16796/c0_g1_i1/m.97711
MSQREAVYGPSHVLDVNKYVEDVGPFHGLIFPLQSGPMAKKRGSSIFVTDSSPADVARQASDVAAGSNEASDTASRRASSQRASIFDASVIGGSGDNNSDQRQWDTEFYDRLGEGDTAEAARVYREFQKEAVELARTLIEDRLTANKVSYTPLVQDPPVYVVKGIQVCLATGNRVRSFYGCTDNAAKVLSNEMRAIQRVFRDVVLGTRRTPPSSEGKHRPRNAELRLPMCTLVKHLGTTAMVSATFPADHDTRLFGLSHANTRLDEATLPGLVSPLNGLMGLLEANLNTAGRYISDEHEARMSEMTVWWGSVTTAMYAPVAAPPVSLGSSTRMLSMSISVNPATVVPRVYVTEIGRAFGAMDPKLSVPMYWMYTSNDNAMGRRFGPNPDRYGSRYIRSHHYQLLRPEAVKRHAEHVPGDGYLTQNSDAHNKVLTDATSQVLKDGVEDVATALLSLTYDECECFTGTTLVNILHQKGVNLRYMGLVLQKTVELCAAALELNEQSSNTRSATPRHEQGSVASGGICGGENDTTTRSGQVVALPSIVDRGDGLERTQSYIPQPPPSHAETSPTSGGRSPREDYTVMEERFPRPQTRVLEVLRTEIIARSCRALLNERLRVQDVGVPRDLPPPPTSPQSGRLQRLASRSVLDSASPGSQANLNAARRRSRTMFNLPGSGGVVEPGLDDEEGESPSEASFKSIARAQSTATLAKPATSKLAQYLSAIHQLNGGSTSAKLPNADTQRTDVLLAPRPPSGLCRDDALRSTTLFNFDDDPLWGHKVNVASMLNRLSGHTSVDDKYWVQTLYPEIGLKFRCNDLIRNLRKVPSDKVIQRLCDLLGVFIPDTTAIETSTYYPRHIVMMPMTKSMWGGQATPHEVAPAEVDALGSMMSMTTSFAMSVSGNSHPFSEEVRTSEELEQQYLADLERTKNYRDGHAHVSILKKLVSLYSLWGGVRASNLAIARKMLAYSQCLQFHSHLKALWETHGLDGICTAHCGICGLVMNLSNYVYHSSSSECAQYKAHVAKAANRNAVVMAPRQSRFAHLRHDTAPTSSNVVFGAYPAGIEDVSIPNEAFTSSSHRQGCEPHFARLNLSCANHWQPTVSDNAQWVGVDLGEVRVVTAVATQGSPSTKMYTATYRVFHSLDGKSWTQYTGPYIHANDHKGTAHRINPTDIPHTVCTREGKVSRGTLWGNKSANDTVRNTFTNPFSTRYVRVAPFDPNYMPKDVALRFEVYCRSKPVQAVGAHNIQHRERVPLHEVDWNSVVDNKQLPVTRMNCARQEAELWQRIEKTEKLLADTAQPSQRTVSELIRLYQALVGLYQGWGPEREGDLNVVRERHIHVIIKHIRTLKSSSHARSRAEEMAAGLPRMLFALSAAPQGPHDHMPVIEAVEELFLDLKMKEELEDFYHSAVMHYGHRNPVIIPLVGRIAKSLVKSGRQGEVVELYKAVLDPGLLETARAACRLPSHAPPGASSQLPLLPAAPQRPRVTPQGGTAAIARRASRVPDVRMQRLESLLYEDEFHIFSEYHPHDLRLRDTIYGERFQALAKAQEHFESVVQRAEGISFSAEEEISFVEDMYPGVPETL